MWRDLETTAIAAFKASGLTKNALAKRLGWSWMRLSRALDPDIETSLSDISALYAALGVRAQMVLTKTATGEETVITTIGIAAALDAHA